MANLDSLNYPSISSRPREESMSVINSIREQRLVQKSSSKTKKQTSKSKRIKEPDLTAEQAARILALLEGK